jgi:hypothetical protein
MAAAAAAAAGPGPRRQQNNVRRGGSVTKVKTYVVKFHHSIASALEGLLVSCYSAAIAARKKKQAFSSGHSGPRMQLPSPELLDEICVRFILALPATELE